MTGDHRCRMQSLDFVERLKPITYGRSVALREIEMRVVVDAVSRYDQPNGRYIQSSCVGRIGVAELHDL